MGCIIFPYDAASVIAFGYNGPPAGLPNDSCTADPGRCGCAHGEANAMVKALPHPGPLVVFCTLTPCASCAPLLINWSAGRVAIYMYDEVYLGPGSEAERGLRMLRESGIDCVKARDVGC